MTRWARGRAAGVVAIVLLNAALAACGRDAGDGAADAGRSVEIEMRDVAFSPTSLDVKDGETVRFVFRNTGKLAHDAFVGDEKAQDDHEKEMREPGDAGGMHHGGDDDAITVEPGESGELTHTFRTGDELLIGCHQAGHYAAGMKVTVDVS